MMISALAVFTAVICVASGASVLDVSVRQGGGPSTPKAPGILAPIGDKKYLLRAMSPDISCPSNITHGLAGPSPFKGFEKYGIEAAMNFSQITVDGSTCEGDQNSTAYMAVLSNDALKSMRKDNPLGVNERDGRKIVVAGIDTQKRKCGDYNAGEAMLYFFTQDIGVLTRALTNLNIKIDANDIKPGDKWMIATVAANGKGSCVYVDENATGILDDNIEASVEPATPEKETTPEDAPPLAGDGGLGGLDSTAEPNTKPASGSVCFPASARVQLQDGTYKTMDTVELGDHILVGANVYSEVYMFTHKLSDTAHEFVNLKTTNGAEVSLTASHYIYVNGQLVPAGNAKVGDMLETATGDASMIEEITTSVREGLFNPQTVHGDIVVDGIRASTYTTVAQPKAAHALLAPLRSLHNKFGWSTAALDAGNDLLAAAVSKIVS